LLSTLPVAQPQYRLAPFAGNPNRVAPFAGGGPPAGSSTPAQIQQAYQFSQVTLNGSTETIAIVDGYNDPDIQSDLNKFDTQFGLPHITISEVNQTGGSSLPSADSTGG
jgi:subtilase family serine protease